MTHTSSTKKSTSPYDQPPPTPHPQRRGILVGFLAGLLGALVGIVPFASGLLVLLDPILKRKSSGGEASAGHDSAKPYLRVTALESLPADGTPVQVPVISDLSDAWNCEPNQPIGAVYLMRKGNEVECFNAICPHAGCFVGYSTERKVFQCPCHTSAFETSGARIMPSPSPRDMDPLAIDKKKLEEGEVWVRFENYYPGKEHREAKA